MVSLRGMARECSIFYTESSFNSFVDKLDSSLCLLCVFVLAAHHLLDLTIVSVEGNITLSATVFVVYPNFKVNNNQLAC